jgi:hypothetical protein
VPVEDRGKAPEWKVCDYGVRKPLCWYVWFRVIRVQSVSSSCIELSESFSEHERKAQGWSHASATMWGWIFV